MLQIRRPVIESQFSRVHKSGYSERASNAIRLEDFFKGYSPDSIKKVPLDIYYTLIRFLLDPETRRIILYLPFGILKDAPLDFRETYLDVWYEMLGVMDVRENFHEGDILEPEARPDGRLERVVKCAHLTPWLIEAGYLTSRDIKEIILSYPNYEILLRSFKETWNIIREREILPPSELRELEALTERISDYVRPEPLFISDNRRKWLEEKNRPVGKLMTPGAYLTGPFYPNLETIVDKLETIKRDLRPDDIAFIGGSFLKGYGTDESDLDILYYSDFKKNPKFYIGDPDKVHIFYTSAWMPGKEVNNIEDYVATVVFRYRKNGKRRESLERLEGNLIQYRLLHKGFSRFTGKMVFNTSSHPEIDGDSPFYDDEFRAIATVLFAKYVWIF